MPKALNLRGACRMRLGDAAGAERDLDAGIDLDRRIISVVQIGPDRIRTEEDRPAILGVHEIPEGARTTPSVVAFSSNGAGTVTVVREESPDKFTVLADVRTQRGARTMALDERTHRLYLPAAQYGEAPAPTAEHPRPRPPMVPGSFVVLVLEPAP